MYEKQMELFEDGGLRDEGGMVDEESGNEVPVGSTRKEVRDDIPAMLSEGEFVFPADVVRYIGLENLMRIRQDAKQGLKQMEAMGQMGNGDEATLPDDMPFGMMDLIIIEGEEEEPQEKAQGGVIHANQGSFIVPKFDPYNQDVRQFENAEGKKLNIPFLGGNPVYPIPEGYFPVGQVPEKDETKEAIPTSDDDEPTTPAPKGYDWNTDTSATDGKALQEWIDNATKTSTAGNIAAGIAAAINPLFGGMVALANKQQKKKITEMLDEKIAQAKKTPIQGQVAALEKIKERLTTKEGKGILGKVISGIIDEIGGALGLTEEEKKKSKVGAVVNSNQSSDEPDSKTSDDAKKATEQPDLVVEDLVKQGIMDANDFAPTIPKESSYDEVPERLKTKADKFREEEERRAKEMDANFGQGYVPIDRRSGSYDEVPTGADVVNAQVKESTMPNIAGSPKIPTLQTPDKIPTGMGIQGFEPSIKAPKEGDTPSSLPLRTEQQVIGAGMTVLQNAVEELRASQPYRGPVSGMSMKEKLEDPLAPFEIGYNKLTEAVSKAVSGGDDTPTPTPKPKPTPSSGGGDDDGPTFAPTPTSTQTEEEKEKTDTAVEKAKETLTRGERMGSAELDKTFGISGLKSGGLASRKKKKK